jgi:signal transduction histidine kinase
VDQQIQYETRSMMSLPICYPGGVAVGVMQLVNKRHGGFSPDELTVLEIVAGVCAMSLHNADLAQQALKTQALGYVAGFAHDIYNKIATFVTGVPTLRSILEDVFGAVKGTAPEETLAPLRDDALELVDFMERDAELVYRYTRFIARLARDLPLDTHFEEADLVETVKGQVLQLGRRAQEQQVEMRVEADQPVICMHDRLLLGSAVYNLVNNALPETRDGTVVVSVRAGEGFAVVEVRDTGRGMSAELLTRILEGNAISTKPGGSGIGTMIVKKVAEIHRGCLEGESSQGAGSTFRIRVPLAS